MQRQNLGGRFASTDHLSTKCQKRSHCLSGLLGQEAFGHRILPFPMVMLWKGLDMLPFPMGRIVVAMDGAIQMLPVPMMGKPAFLHFRPPEIDVASVD